MGLNERTELLFGSDGMEAIESLQVMIVGIGGVGSNCALSLARSGVGKLILVDYDIVSASNANRQAIAFRSTIGRKKTEVAQELIADINPAAEVVAIDRKILPEDVDWLLGQAGKPDWIIDCSDTITTKVALAKSAEELGIGYVAGMGSGNKFDPLEMEFSDIYETRICPVCKAVRKAARKEGLQRMQVLYSPEEPIGMTAEDDFARRERRNVGTVAYYPAIMGHLLASYVLRKATGR